ADALFHYFVGDRGDGYDVARDDHFLRFGAARAHHGTGDVRAGLCAEARADSSQRHFAGAVSFNRLENVGALDASLVGGPTGNHRDHGRIAEPLGNGRADVGFRVRLLGLVILVFLRAQVAGIRVKRLQQTVKRSIGDLWDVWIFHVLAVYTRKHFAIDL